MIFHSILLKHGQQAPWELITHVRIMPGRSPDTEAARKAIEHIKHFANSDGIAAIDDFTYGYPSLRKDKPNRRPEMFHELRYFANSPDAGNYSENKGLIQLGWIEAPSGHGDRIESLESNLSAEVADKSEPELLYSPDGSDCRATMLRQINERQGQPQFRDALRKRYGDLCLVTGCTIFEIIEAAHIDPYRGEQTNHPANGLLLRADIHTLFDLDLLGIEPTTLRIELHPRIRDEYFEIVKPELLCLSD